MAYVGNPIDTQNTFQSLVGKRFNGDGSTTDFTLDVAPSSTLDIEVFVGNVRQDPNSAYTLSGTTLSFTGAPPSGTNNIYVVHQAKAVGTIDVPASGVQAGSLASSVLTGQTDIGAAIADADLFLVDDGAGGTLRKTAASRIKTYIGAGTNTPFVMVGKTSTSNISDNTWTTVVFDNELYDASSVYNTSNGECTPTAGTYHIFSHVGIGNSADDAVSDMGIKILIGGSTVLAENTNYNVDVQRLTMSTNAIYTFDGSTNFVIQAYNNVTSGTPNIDGVSATRWGTFMGMYKIIT